MSLNIDFSPQAEAWIQTQAVKQGVQPAEIVRRVVDERATLAPPTGADNEQAASARLPLDAKAAAAIALLDSWIAEGAAADAETRRQAEQEVEEFKRNMNANRAATGERHVFP